MISQILSTKIRNKNSQCNIHRFFLFLVCVEKSQTKQEEDTQKREKKRKKEMTNTYTHHQMFVCFF
jgi:hypothetical protein